MTWRSWYCGRTTPMADTAAAPRARVLICEDEGLTALRLKKALTTLGYEVVGEAKNGEEAVAQAARLQPDAILMDIRMPKLDGIAARSRSCASARRRS